MPPLSLKGSTGRTRLISISVVALYA
jgi:hypothetical protein